MTFRYLSCFASCRRYRYPSGVLLLTIFIVSSATMLMFRVKYVRMLFHIDRGLLVSERCKQTCIKVCYLMIVWIFFIKVIVTSRSVVESPIE